MNDDLTTLRAADPAPAHAEVWRDRPPPVSAERFVASARTATHRPGASRAPVGGPGARRLPIVLAGVAAAVVTALVQVTSGAPPVPVPVAAVAPLPAAPAAPAPSLAQMSARAAALAAATPGPAVPGSHVKEWALGFGTDARIPVERLAEERLFRPEPDGGATRWTRDADPVGTEGLLLGPAGRVPSADVREVRMTAAERRAMSLFPVPPPDDAAALAEHLAALLGPRSGEQSAGHRACTDVGHLLLEWTPGTSTTAAIAALLMDSPGLQPRGAVTDRLGRPGVAFAADAALGGVPTRCTVVLDAATGRVLGTELSLLAEVGEFAVPPFSVLQYDAYAGSAGR